MALKSLEILARPETLNQVAETSRILTGAFASIQSSHLKEIRGRGVMWGVELDRNAGPLLGDLLRKGLLFLADGPEGNVLSFTPPFTISGEEVQFAMTTISELLSEWT